MLLKYISSNINILNLLTYIKKYFKNAVTDIIKCKKLVKENVVNFKILK